MSRGIFKLKNATETIYSIAELGHIVTIDPGAEVDIMDPSLPMYYDAWLSIEQIKRSTTSQLAQSIQAGDLEITAEQPPSEFPFPS
jgi:hypothetical protein